MGVGSWGSPIGTYTAISGMNRRVGGGSERGDEGMFFLLYMLLCCLAFVLAIVVLVAFRDQYQRDTTYSLKTYACTSTSVLTQTCTVSAHDNIWFWQDESELDTSEFGIPHVHKPKHHRVKQIDCQEWDLVDVCSYDIVKITDLGKWRKVE
jgi:hypothetical protein